MNQSKKLNQVVFFNLLGPVLLNGINFFTIPIFTRLLGAENYGVYTIYASYQPILLIFMGLQTGSVIGPASIYYTGKEKDRILSNTLAISLTFCAILTALVIVFMKAITAFTELPSAIIYIMLAHTFGCIGVQWALGKFSYDKKAKTNFIYSITIAVLGVILSFALINWLLKDRPSYEGYIIGHAVPYIIAGTGFFIYFILKGKSFFSKEGWKFCFALCLPIVFHALSNTVLHQSAKVILQKFCDASVTGIFGFAVTFSNVINILMNAFNSTWVPFYHDDIREDNKEHLKKKTNNYVFLFSCLTIGFIMAMPEVVKIFAQEEFWSSIKIIPLLAAGHYFTFLYTFPVNFEFYHKKTKNIALGTTVTCIINIGLSFLFINFFGIIGAAIATMLSCAILYLFHLIIAKYLMKEEYHYDYKFFYIYILIVTAFTLLFYLIIDFIYIRWLVFIIAAILLLYRTVKNKSIF